MALKSGRVGIHPSQVDPITGMLLVDPSGASDLSDLQDVDIQDPAAGQILVYDGDKWANEYSSISPTTPHELKDLQDVNITTPAGGQTLEYDADSEKWVNVFASTSPTTPATLQSLQDVLISSPEDGQSLVYDSDSEKWVNEFSSISPYALSQLPDVDIDDPTDGDYLTYDGTSGKWVNSGSAPAPTYTDVTLTIYSAVEDLISFTDAAGITHTEQLAENQSSKSITFKINPTGDTSITFTSSIAKDPDNLSNYYSKTVSISSGTTSVYFMPNDNVLYWYGYQSDNCEEMNTTNGWSHSNQSFTSPTYNKNNVYINAPASKIQGIGSKNTVALTKLYSITQVTTSGLYLYGWTQKNVSGTTYSDGGITITSTSLVKSALTPTTGTADYLSLYGSNSKAGYIYALWYE